MIDHVIFDLDGTLIDSSMICTDILNDMLRDRGSVRTITPDQAKPFLSRGGSHMVAGLLGEECGQDAAEIADFRERYAARATPAESLYAGVREGLAHLASNGFGLAICSNKPQNLCEKVLDELGLAPLFSVVVGGAPDLRPKPAPDLMDKALGELRITAERCLFVGDSDLDQAIAAATGVNFLYVSYGYAPEDWDTGSLVQFNRFGDLVHAVVAAHGVAQPLRRVA